MTQVELLSYLLALLFLMFGWHIYGIAFFSDSKTERWLALLGFVLSNVAAIICVASNRIFS